MVINLWSGPRNISTALMYSFANRKDCTVYDEPFYAHYLMRTGLDHPGRDEVLQSQGHVPEDIGSEISDNDEQPIVFVKNMAHHSEGINPELTADWKNIFLLREPDQMITSFIKQIPNPSLQDLACEYQFKLLEESLKRQETPVVINSKDLLIDPESYLRKLCSALQIPFDNGMLSWEKGPIKEDGIWAKYWYKSVHQSTGFQPYNHKEEQVPERLQNLLKKCESYYEQLIKHAL